MIGYWVAFFCVGTVLHKPFRKLCISDMAMEKNKGRTVLVLFGTGMYMDKSSVLKGWWGLLWKASKCEKLCAKTKRQDLAMWDLVYKDGNIILTASTSKNPPMGSQKLCCSHALLLDAPSSAPGGSSPAVSNAKGQTQAQRSSLTGLEAGHPKPHL